MTRSCVKTSSLGVISETWEMIQIWIRPFNGEELKHPVTSGSKKHHHKALAVTPWLTTVEMFLGYILPKRTIHPGDQTKVAGLWVFAAWICFFPNLVVEKCPFGGSFLGKNSFPFGKNRQEDVLKICKRPVKTMDKTPWDPSTYLPQPLSATFRIQANVPTPVPTPAPASESVVNHETKDLEVGICKIHNVWLSGVFKYFYFHRYLGKWSKLTSIFLRWVGEKPPTNRWWIFKTIKSEYPCNFEQR